LHFSVFIPLFWLKPLSLCWKVPELTKKINLLSDGCLLIVNNAGIINKNAKLWEIPKEEFDAVIDTNVKGTANCIRHFAKHMIQRGQGVIVNVSSGWGRAGAAEASYFLCLSTRPLKFSFTLLK
jgi:NAD(P)-dependent dehydrogenase (short-subunit alcohol dehydrogenase family)